MTVSCLRAPALAERPTIADETFLDVERAGVEHLALTLARAAHDQLERAALARRALELGQRGLELGVARVCDAAHGAGGGFSPKCRSMMWKMSVCRTCAGTSFAAAP